MAVRFAEGVTDAMKTRPLCFVCLLILLVEGIFMIVTGGKSLIDTPADSIFYQEIEKTVTIQGQVYRKTDTSNYQIYYLKNNSTNDSKLLIYDSQFTNIPIGMNVTIQGSLGFFEHAQNPGNFDQKLYYAKQNIYGQIWCEKVINVSGRENKLLEMLYRIKANWKKTLINCLGEKNGGIMATMLLGDKSNLNSSMRELYQNNGISHILAISGLHISFIGLGIYQLLRKTGLGFCGAGILAMGGLTLYMLMIGFSVSSFRAYFMLLVKVGADLTGRIYDMLTAVMLAAVFTVLYQPLYLLDAGFYMSYGALLGILIVLPILQYCFPCRWKVISGFYTSIAINILLFPITLWFYYVFPTYSFLLNALILPFVGIVLGFGILGSFCFMLHEGVGKICLQICGWILNFYELVCQIGNRLPVAKITLGKPAIWEVVLYYVLFLLIILFYSFARKKKYNKRYRFVWLLLLLPIGFMSYQPKGFLNITVLDVGQGDGLYLQGPRGNTYFIDGGSSDVGEVGKYRIEPFLKSQGVGYLDYVFISHGDIDHYSGIEEMLERQETGIVIRNLVLPSNYREDDAMIDLAKKAKKEGVHVLVINRGEYVREGELYISCLQPSDSDGDLTGNAGSMVLEVVYQNFSMLCTGDVEAEGEEILVKRLHEAEYDVLKVAHHGSKNSTSEVFLQQVSPQIALISAGKDNRYNHPHDEVIDRLTDIGSMIFNTQENGAITLRTDGNSLTIW